MRPPGAMVPLRVMVTSAGTRESTPRLERLSVIVPVYNEDGAIKPVIEELLSACPDVEIVVVDDGSSDGTPDELAQLQGIVVVRHDRNRGYGAALKSGMRRASRDFVAWYDGDGQHTPEDLMAVATPVIDGRQDMVVGARTDASVQKLDRVVGKAILTRVAQFLTGEAIPDLNSGLRCFPVSLIRRYVHLLPDGFSASTTSTLCIIERGYRVQFHPITTRVRSGQSKVRLMNDGIQTARLIFRLVVLFNALKVFTVLGAALIVPSFLYGLVVALRRGEGFPTLAGIAIIAGLLTIFLGIVADQITELRKERFEEPWV